MASTALEQLQPETLSLLRRHNLLTQLISAEVIREAVDAIVITPEQSSQLLQNYCEQRKLTDNSRFDEHLRELGFLQSDLQWQLELPLRVQAYGKQEFGHKAQARFLTQKERLDQVVYSLLRVKDSSIARELYLQIQGHEADFGDLAAKFAEGPEKVTKGILGPSPLMQAHPILAEKLRTTEVGQLMEPFAIGEWWLIARLERYEPAKFNNAIEKQMTDELFKEWVKAETAVKITKLSLRLGESKPA